MPAYAVVDAPLCWKALAIFEVGRQSVIGGYVNLKMPFD